MSEGIDIDHILARTEALRDALSSAAPMLDAIAATVAAHAGGGARGLAQHTGDAVAHNETETGDSQ